MRYLIILLLSINAGFPLETPEIIRYPHKCFFTKTDTIMCGKLNPANNNFICEDTIEPDGKPTSITWLKLNADGSVKCPIEVDSVKKAAAISAAEALASREAILSAIRAAKKCGLSVIEEAQFINLTKNPPLSDAQRITVATEFAEAKSHLENGYLDSAEIAINAIAPSGTTTADDKIKVIAKLQACK